MEATKQTEEKRKKPEPEEQEGMPQRQHCTSVEHVAAEETQEIA
jgi:hypothetical protein